ncbi:MAG: response regulator [Deltaproteobacteria bacterium]|nr:MAG: response regulator [Deltaproteobacteria bacterium]
MRIVGTEIAFNPGGEQGAHRIPRESPRVRERSIMAAAESHILLIEDNPDDVFLLKELLYTVHGEETATILLSTAATLAEGMEKLARRPFDLLLLDLTLPDSRGMETFETIHDRFAHVPVILLTGLKDEALGIRAVKQGAQDYLVKGSFDHHLLRRSIFYAIERHRLVRNLHRQMEMLEALTTASLRFVPQDLLHLLRKETIDEVALGDHIHLEMAVMFSDIRNFTALSERLTVQENFNLINNFLKRLSPIIRKNGGFVIKFLGDGIMAVFPENPDAALVAGIEKLRAVRLYNEHRKKMDYCPIEIGIGVHFGKMMLGVIGEEERIGGDILSDAVNLGARLESLTKRYGVSFIVSESVIQHLQEPERFHARKLGRVQVKGKQEVVSIYEIFDGALPEEIERKETNREIFESGIDAYFSGRIRQAQSCFQEVAALDPTDSACRYYLSLIGNGAGTLSKPASRRTPSAP